MQPSNNFFTARNNITLLLIAFLDSILTYLVIVQDAGYIYRENSWIENMQVGFLFAAFLAFLTAALRVNKHNRNICLFFATLSFIFMFREIDVEKLDVHQWLIFLLAEQGRGIFFVILFFLLALELKNYRHYTDNIRYFISSSLFVFLSIAAFLLIVFSTAFDQKLIQVNYRIFFEELSEMTAYCFIAATAFFARQELKLIDQKIQLKNNHH